MPIFQDDLGGGQRTPPPKPGISLSNSPLDRSQIGRKVSEESIRTELCEGPLLDSPEDNKGESAGNLNTGFTFPILGTSDRVELIERLKRGQSAAWLPNRNVSSHGRSS
jgi:hypothetical protein